MIVYALDSNFNLVATAIPYTLLDWTRRYYDFGEFMLEIPLSKYDPTWAYIGVVGREELGIVQRDTDIYSSKNSIVLSGFFCEKMLDEKVCYPRYIGDVSHTETAVRNIFTRYKADLPITLDPPNEPLLGDRTQSDFSDDYMGTKLFRMLESRECSYKVYYSFLTNDLRLKVWQGVDRTQEQTINAPKVFSTKFGNIASSTYLRDISAYKNYAIIPADGDDDNKEQQTFYLDLTNGDSRRETVIDLRAEHPSEGQSAADFKAAMLQEAAEKMKDYAIVEDVDLQPVEKDEYMINYDLGDKCDLLIADLGIEVQARIVEVTETVTAEKSHTITLGFGNKRISNYRRAGL